MREIRENGHRSPERRIGYSLKILVMHSMYSVSQKNPPYGFLKFFPKQLEIFNQFFTHLLYDHFYTRVQIFIQIYPTSTKLCHTKRDHLAKFYISLEL